MEYFIFQAHNILENYKNWIKKSTRKSHLAM